MSRSRLEKVRNRKAGKQGVTYLLLAIGLIVVTVIWGLPAVARLSGYLIKTDRDPFVEDELRPTPPIFSDIPEATYSGQVKIAGFAQPGLEVILYINGAEFERKLVSESGTFNFDKVGLTEGENTAYAYTTTARELQSEQSKTYTVVVDMTNPKVTLDSPKEGEVFRGQSQRITTFSGSVSELGSKVYIGERMVIVQSDGKFSLPYQLIEGDQEVQIKAVDKAGNEGMSSIKLKWEP
jgi:hypothetical protein